MNKNRAPRNRTIELTDDELQEFSEMCTKTEEIESLSSVENTLIFGDLFEVAHLLPSEIVDLLVVDRLIT